MQETINQNNWNETVLAEFVLFVSFCWQVSNSTINTHTHYRAFWDPSFSFNSVYILPTNSPYTMGMPRNPSRLHLGPRERSVTTWTGRNQSINMLGILSRTPTHWHIFLKDLSMCEKKYATYNHNKKTVKVNLWKSPIYFHTSKNLFAAKSHSRLKLWMQQNHQYSRAKCKSNLQTQTSKQKHCKASFPFWDGFLEGAILVPKMMSALPHPHFTPRLPDANWACRAVRVADSVFHPVLFSTTCEHLACYGANN